MDNLKEILLFFYALFLAFIYLFFLTIVNVPRVIFGLLRVLLGKRF